MTTEQRLAMCDALADALAGLAITLNHLATELSELRDDARAALGLPGGDPRQLKLGTAP